VTSVSLETELDVATTRRSARSFAHDIPVWLALGYLVLIVLAIVFPQLFTGYDPLKPSAAATLRAPSWQHWFGTDYLGRDVFARVVYGTARTLTGSLVAVSIGLFAGILLGLAAASLGGVIDSVIGRLVDVLLSIPGLLLSMVIVVALGFGTFTAAIAVGIASVATFTRLMRSEVLTVGGLTFVEASRHIGGGTWHVLFRHVLPNSYSSVLALSALQFGNSILWIAALSFLGYGAPPPQPEWGLLISEGRQYIVSSPWLVLLPGLVIVLTVLSISRLSIFVKEKLG